MYRVITGSCESGTRYFVEQNKDKIKESYTIREVIELTKGQYNNLLVEFLKARWNKCRWFCSCNVIKRMV